MILRFDPTSSGPLASKYSQETKSSSELVGSSGLFSVEDYPFPVFDGEGCPSFLMSTVSEFPYPESSSSHVLLFECLHLDNAISHILHLALDRLIGGSAHCEECLAI